MNNVANFASHNLAIALTSMEVEQLPEEAGSFNKTVVKTTPGDDRDYSLYSPEIQVIFRNDSKKLLDHGLKSYLNLYSHIVSKAKWVEVVNQKWRELKHLGGSAMTAFSTNHVYTHGLSGVVIKGRCTARCGVDGAVMMEPNFIGLPVSLFNFTLTSTYDKMDPAALEGTRAEPLLQGMHPSYFDDCISEQFLSLRAADNPSFGYDFIFDQAPWFVPQGRGSEAVNKSLFRFTFSANPRSEDAPQPAPHDMVGFLYIDFVDRGKADFIEAISVSSPRSQVSGTLAVALITCDTTATVYTDALSQTALALRGFASVRKCFRSKTVRDGFFDKPVYVSRGIGQPKLVARGVFYRLKAFFKG